MDDPLKETEEQNASRDIVIEQMLQQRGSMAKTSMMRIFGNACYWTAVVLAVYALFNDGWFLLAFAFILISIGYVLRVRYPNPDAFTAKKFWRYLSEERQLMRDERRRR